MSVRVEHGDCLAILPTLDAESFHACVTDPPYHLTSIVKRFGGENAAPAQFGRDGAYARASAGFMGKTWDGGDIALRPETWVEVLRVLKPGAHLLAFGGTRTFHRMACAIEDAGFEIRDTVMWVYGSGFPKSHDVSKGIDKAAGAEREVIGPSARRVSGKPNQRTSGLCGSSTFAEYVGMGATVTAPATPEAATWSGWGTALKPSFEPLIVARKPLDNMDVRHQIDSIIVRLERQLWSLLPANVAETHFRLSQSEFAEVCASAQWSAAERSNTRADLSGQMDMSRFASAMISSLNTASLWRLCLDAISTQENTSITGMASKTTIDLKIWKSCLSRITPASIILAHRSGAWSDAHAEPAVRLLTADAQKWSATQELSVIESAGWPDAAAFPAGDAISPSIQPIIVARKPLVGTVAANVLKHGCGGLNIDGCRVPMQSDADRESARPAGLATGKPLSRLQGVEDGRAAFAPSDNSLGRWPANLIHDGSEEVLAAFPDAPGQHVGSGSAARFFKTCRYSEEEWNAFTNARDAAPTFDLQSELAVFALSDAVARPTGRLALQRQSYQGQSMTVTAGELRMVCASVTALIQNIEQRCSQEWPQQRLTLTNSPVVCVARQEPTGTMTITASLLRSDGCAELATFNIIETKEEVGAPDFAQASRLFYTSKADASDRAGSKHPTVKPLDLMRYLVRLVTPLGGMVLDPFAGSGTTGEAAQLEGFNAVLIEREAEYVADIQRRLGRASGDDTPLFAQP